MPRERPFGFSLHRLDTSALSNFSLQVSAIRFLSDAPNQATRLLLYVAGNVFDCALYPLLKA
jgi:hypothetical protein